MIVLKVLMYWTLVSIIVTPIACQVLFGGCGWKGIASMSYEAMRRKQPAVA